MLDNDMDRGANEVSRERTNRPADTAGARGDREVPLTSHTTSDVIHRWLDGETTEPAGLRGESAREVEFWRRIGEETDRRRRMATPAHLSAKIMAALPTVEAPKATTTSWRDARLSPGVMLAAAAGLLALGALVASFLIQQ
ncbi:MAG: hypothetical protein ACT4P6_23735 [Gemmatimonadaceae bacterium]